MFAPKWACRPHKLARFFPWTLASLGIECSILMRCHNQIAALSFIPREVICLRFLFFAVLSSLSMAKASVTRPAAISLPEPLASGESAALPAEEVVCFLSLFLWCSAPSICCVCCAELMLAMVVLLTYVASSVALAQHLSSFCFVFVASGACLQGSHVAYVILLMVFSFFAICVLEISFHGVLPSSYFELFS